MRTTLDLPEPLLLEAQQILGFKSKTDTIVQSLRELVRRNRIDQLRATAFDAEGLSPRAAKASRGLLVVGAALVAALSRTVASARQGQPRGLPLHSERAATVAVCPPSFEVSGSGLVVPV